MATTPPVAIVDDGSLICSVTIPGDPVPKGRPRFGSGRAYTPKRTAAAEEHIGWLAKSAMLGRPPVADVELDVEMVFYLRNRRRGRARLDLDNLVKLVLDACNGVVWHDDSQVTHFEATLFRWDAPPRTELIVRKAVP